MKSLRRLRSTLVVAITVIGFSVTLSACGGSSGPTLVLYNGQHVQLTSALVTAFEKQTGINVEIRTNDSVVLADQILQEGSASPADVYIAENSPELMNLEEHKMLARLPASVLDQVPASDDSPTGDWVGMALRVSSLAYDPSLVKRDQLPASVLAFAEPQWKGKIAVAPTDSDFPPLVGAIVATYGKATAVAWLAGLKRNAQTYQDEESVVAAVNRGDVACGIINQYYWYRLALEVGNSAMHSTLYYFPRHNVGSITNISGAAILATSSHRSEAERFLAFIVSKQGQRILAGSDDFEYPVRTGIAANPQLPPLATIAHATINVVSLGNDLQAARLIQQAGLL